ncbi:dihydropteroate synthase [Microbacterium sp. NPDC076911]|uniref:dihydropteroate synthase n=1 Tax=Microbacterium sp. NPDC076911 TaxID=3154958 RepID=UPI0034276088
MTLVMGIVNVTPDSFSDGGRFLATDAAIAHALQLRSDGADIIDIGGESTRPGAQRVDPGAERDRVLPVIAGLAAAEVAISIDTMNASTALAAVNAGACIVNDVSGGLADSDMLDALAPTGVHIALGHWRGPSAHMYARATYDDVAEDVERELRERVDAALAAGFTADRIIVDPGIGFGKAGAQNWATLRGTERLATTGQRVLIGTSRKRFLAEMLATDAIDADEQRRDLATAATSLLAAQAGAWAVRVHNVGATRDALNVLHHWEGPTS